MNDISRIIANQNPDAIANRLANKVEYRDGLQEISIGVFILFFAGLAGLQAVLNGSNGSRALFWGCLLLMPVGFVSQWAIKKVRKRFLAGKVGYVKLKPLNKKRLGMRFGIVFIRSCVIAVLFGFLVAKVVVATLRGGGVAHWGLFSPTGWALVGTGILVAAIMIIRVRLLRYVIGSVVLAVLSILLAFSGVSYSVGSAILYGFPGLLAVISGSIVFLHVLRQPAEPGELG